MMQGRCFFHPKTCVKSVHLYPRSQNFADDDEMISRRRPGIESTFKCTQAFRHNKWSLHIFYDDCTQTAFLELIDAAATAGSATAHNPFRKIMAGYADAKFTAPDYEFMGEPGRAGATAGMGGFLLTGMHHAAVMRLMAFSSKKMGSGLILTRFLATRRLVLSVLHTQTSRVRTAHH